ncbi:MAG: PEP-CTERM sorting domain-containing protein [Planctomycetota bacterium]
MKGVFWRILSGVACAAALFAGPMAVEAASIGQAIGESDVDRVRMIEYNTGRGGSTTFSESIELQLEAAFTLDPGETVSLDLAFPEPLNVESFFTGERFDLLVQFSNESLAEDATFNVIDTNFAQPATLLGADNFAEIVETASSVRQTFGSRWEVNSQHRLVPDTGFGELTGLTWEFTAPDFVLTSTDVNFRFSVETSVTAGTIDDPGRDLITLVPEPASLALVVFGGLLLTARSRRS